LAAAERDIPIDRPPGDKATGIDNSHEDKDIVQMPAQHETTRSGSSTAMGFACMSPAIRQLGVYMHQRRCNVAGYLPLASRVPGCTRHHVHRAVALKYNRSGKQI
jgi:hypothetical protein